MSMRKSEFVEHDGYNTTKPGWRGMPRPTKWRPKREVAGGSRAQREAQLHQAQPGQQGAARRRRRLAVAERARATGPALAAWAAVEAGGRNRLTEVLFAQNAEGMGGFSSDEDAEAFLSDDEAATEEMERGRAALAEWQEGQARRVGGVARAAARDGAAAAQRGAAQSQARVERERASSRTRVVRLVRRSAGFPAAEPREWPSELFRAGSSPQLLPSSPIIAHHHPDDDFVDDDFVDDAGVSGGGGAQHGSPTRTAHRSPERSATLSSNMSRSSGWGEAATLRAERARQQHGGDVRPTCSNCGLNSAHSAHYCAARAALGKEGPRTAARKERYRRKERQWLAAEAKVQARAEQEAKKLAREAEAAAARAAEVEASEAAPSDQWLLWQALVGRPMSEVWEKLPLGEAERRLQGWLGEAHDEWRACLLRRRAFRDDATREVGAAGAAAASVVGGRCTPSAAVPSGNDFKVPGGELCWLLRSEDRRRSFPLVTRTLLSSPPPWPSSTVGDEVFKVDQCLAATASTPAVAAAAVVAAGEEEERGPAPAREEEEVEEEEEEEEEEERSETGSSQRRQHSARPMATPPPDPAPLGTVNRLTHDVPMQRLLTRLTRDAQWGSRAPQPRAARPGWFGRSGGWVVAGRSMAAGPSVRVRNTH